MTTFHDAFEVVQKHQVNARLGGHESLFQTITEACFFILLTGQDYQLEEYHRSLDAQRASPSGMDVWEEARDAQELLSQLQDATPSAGEKELLLVIIDVFNYLVATRQRAAFEDFRKDFYKNPNQVIAHFNTREEAQAWLDDNPRPPSRALVLIGDEYHEVWYSRERSRRGVRRDYSLESFVFTCTQEGLPPAEASFDSREEADAWLLNHPAQPMSVFVMIAGQHHLGVHFKNIKHRVFYRLSEVESYPAIVARLAGEK